MPWQNDSTTELVLPSGATSGQRIVLDSTTDQIAIYNASNVLVLLLDPSGIKLYDPASGALRAEGTLVGGSNGDPGWVGYNNSNNNNYVFLGNSNVEFGYQGIYYWRNPSIQSFDNSGNDPFTLTIDCGAVSGTTFTPQIQMKAATSGHSTVLVQGATGLADLKVTGNLTAGSRAWGSVNITPTAANTPTSTVISGLGLTGTNAHAVVTANTSVPGTQVTGASVTSVTNDGMTVWVTRTNTTTTNVHWLLET